SINSTFADAHQIGERDRHVVQRKTKRRAVKITAGNYVAGFGEDERIIGGRTGLNQQNICAMRKCITNRAVNLRHATETVSVLDTRVVLAMGFANFAPLQ